MKTRRTQPWLILAALVIAAPLLSGCAGASTVLGASWPGLAVQNNTIYLSYAKVYAFNVDGTPKWSFPDSSHQLAQNQAFFAPPASDDKLVVVTDYTDSVFGLNPADGAQQWVFKSNGSRFIGGPVLSDKLIYAATADGTVHAIDRNATEGVAKQVWSFPTEGSIWSTPLLAEGTLYVTSMDKHVYALDAQTGKLQWKYPDQDSEPENPPVGGIVGTPTLHKGVLYFGSFNNRLYALDIKTRKVLWRYATTNWVWGSPVVDDTTGYVVAADLDGNIVAFDPSSSHPENPVWIETTKPTEAAKAAGLKAPVVGSPVLRKLADGKPVLYIASDGDPNLYILRVKDGKDAVPDVSKDHMRIRYHTPGMFLFFPTGVDNPAQLIKLYSSPAFTDDTIIMASQDGPNQIYAFNATTLEYKWKPQATSDVDKTLLAKSGQQTSQDTGLFGNPQTLLLMLGVFFVVSLLLRPGQGKK